jgi:hypothetical protein
MTFPAGAAAGSGADPIDELRFLANALRDIAVAGAAAQWHDADALSEAVRAAQIELRSARGTAGEDIAVTGASADWLARAQERRSAIADAPDGASSPAQADADAIVAVGLARLAVAEAVVAVARAHHRSADVADPAPSRFTGLRRGIAAVGELGPRIRDELRHVSIDKPRSILIRLMITLAISLSVVVVHHFSGFAKYDDAGQLSLYLFSAVVGSVVCTNALCFEAQRVRAALSGGDRLWRILVAKNLAMAVLVTAVGLPVIGILTVTGGRNPVAMVDQLLTMVFIWLGVGNVLSVLYPLRHEPLSARLRDGTWKPYLFLFVLSYGVGLTVNLMIYWRLWARHKAADELTGGQWAAFVLVLASAASSWLLLTVFAVACSREPRLRRVLSREMVPYRKPAAG